MRPFKSGKSKKPRHTKSKPAKDMPRFEGATPFREGEKDYEENPVRKDGLSSKEDKRRFGGATTEEV